jgi:hypothetical protein
MKIKLLLASLKTPMNLKKFSESRLKFLFWLSFALIGRVSPLPVHSWPAFEAIFSIAGGFRKNFESMAAIEKSQQAH